VCSTQSKSRRGRRPRRRQCQPGAAEGPARFRDEAHGAAESRPGPQDLASFFGEVPVVDPAPPMTPESRQAPPLHASAAPHPPTPVLTHVDARGRLGMVDVGHKAETRVRTAHSLITFARLTSGWPCAALGGGLRARLFGQPGIRAGAGEPAEEGVCGSACPPAALMSVSERRATCWWWRSWRASRPPSLPRSSFPFVTR